MSNVRAKICGLNDEASVAAAIAAKADFVGFVFFPKSPRSVTAEIAGKLATKIPESINIVGLFVNPEDALLEEVLDNVPLNLIQLHGKESVERVSEIKSKFGLPVMKAVAVENSEDLEAAKSYETVVDMLLFDAKAPKNMQSALPGGNGIAFDWKILTNQQYSKPWMLAGGLNLSNVEEAVKTSGATIVDTSSGVELEPGKKDTKAISAFLNCVHTIQLEEQAG